MQAIKVGESMTLVFTKVLDEFTRGLVDEDEDAEAAPTDRAYWEQRASKATVALADKMLDVLREFDSSLNLKYNKFYIGLERDGRPYNFVHFIPRKNQLNVVFKLPQSEKLDSKIDAADLDTLEYNERWGQYRLRLTKDDVNDMSEVLKELSQLAYERRTNA